MYRARGRDVLVYTREGVSFFPCASEKEAQEAAIKLNSQEAGQRILDIQRILGVLGIQATELEQLRLQLEEKANSLLPG